MDNLESITSVQDEDVVEKISVKDYLDNNDLLSIVYIPFDTKMEVVSHVITGILNSIGGLNTTLLRRVFMEAIINTITNIDMDIKDENGLDGFDQLYYYRGTMDMLINAMGSEYTQFKEILDERVSDYIRIETNPALTVQKIYEQVIDRIGAAMDYLSENIQNIDVEQLGDQLAQLVNKVGEANEG